MVAELSEKALKPVTKVRRVRTIFSPGLLQKWSGFDKTLRHHQLCLWQQNRYFKPKNYLFLTLTKWIICHNIS